MSTLLTVILFLIPPVAIFSAVFAGLKSFTRTKSAAKALKTHFATLVTLFVFCLFGTFAASAETAAAAAETAASNSAGLGYIAAALCTGLCAIGGGIALAAGIPAAIGATSEDPKAFGKALIFVALGETLALYGVIISFMIISSL